MATEREVLLEEALFELRWNLRGKIEGICDNAIAPFDDTDRGKLERIWNLLEEALLVLNRDDVLRAGLDIHSEYRAETGE